MNGLEGGEADGRRRRKQAARPTTGEQAHRQKHSGQRGGRTNGISSRRPRQQTQETGGPADERRTGAQTETRTDREVDGQTEAQVADHVSRRRKQAARPTTGEQAHRQKHGRTERWTDQRKLK